MRLRLRGQKGFTLVETLIALTILAVIAVSIFFALNVSIKTTASVDHSTTAESLTRTALEIVKQCDYEDIDPVTSYQGVVNDNMQPFPGGYDVQVVEAVPIEDDLQKVKVKVDYDGEEVMTTDSYKMQR